MSIRRREVLALGAVSLAFGVGGCSPFALARTKKKRKVRKYLSGLDGVASVEVDVDLGLVTDDRWDVIVNLKGDPGQDSVLAIIRNARNEVVNLADSDKVELDVKWTQGATSMSCHLPMDDSERAVPAAGEGESATPKAGAKAASTAGRTRRTAASAQADNTGDHPADPSE